MRNLKRGYCLSEICEAVEDQGGIEIMEVDMLLLSSFRFCNLRGGTWVNSKHEQKK